MLLPETRQVELRQQFKLTQTIKLYGQIITDRKFIIYALTLCIAQAGFFAYIAGSASVFISEYQLSSTQFRLLFALNAFGLIGAAILNPKIHEKFGPLNAYKIMNISFLLIMAVLILALCLGYSNLAIFCITLFIAVALLGFIMPTGSQLALMFQHKNAGTASALLGALQFGFGAIITSLTGTFSSFGGLGLVTIMFACALISALLCLITFPKQLPMSQH